MQRSKCPSLHGFALDLRAAAVPRHPTMVSTVIARVQGPQRRKAANRRAASFCGSARRRVSPTWCVIPQARTTAGDGAAWCKV